MPDASTAMACTIIHSCLAVPRPAPQVPHTQNSRRCFLAPAPAGRPCGPVARLARALQPRMPVPACLPVAPTRAHAMQADGSPSARVRGVALGSGVDVKVVVELPSVCRALLGCIL